jgi:hypothetical protein
MLLTPRDVELLCTVYELRQLTGAQIERLLFAGRSPTVLARRLAKLRVQEFLVARGLPVERTAGRSPYVYSLGPAGAGIVAEALGLPVGQVQRRQRQDSRLHWLWFPHRQAVADVRVAFLRACKQRGYLLRWETDEELAERKLPTRPDAFFTITVPNGPRAAFFLEVQLTSRPVQWQEKARKLLPYYTSGAYSTDFGARSLRVLSVTKNRKQVEHLAEKVRELHMPQLFWISDLAAVQAAPLDRIWFVGGGEIGELF